MNAISEASVATLRPVSADSHVMEPPDCYSARIDPAFRDRAPRIVQDPAKGWIVDMDGMAFFPLRTTMSAGIDRSTLTPDRRFEDLHRGSWDPKARLADQDRDGVVAEVIYPSIGMMLCNVPDYDYQHACFRAYNLWLQEFVSHAPDRLYGIGQTAARSAREMVDDLQAIKEAGFVGVMLPGQPQEEDYDSPIYDPVWRAAEELGLPISFHSLTSKNSNMLLFRQSRGPKINDYMAITRLCQDLIGLFVFAGIFERFPGLKLVSVESDAGWAPHLMHRMDHVYESFSQSLQCAELSKRPSDYVRESVYLTFQDDRTAFQLANFMNPNRLLWANDFPHSDSTWPNSQRLLAEFSSLVDRQQLKDIVHNNVAGLYALKV
jgi:predicted TIM-barrel fold metal-dependent hydrolase